MEERALLKSPLNSMSFEKRATAYGFGSKASTFADKDLIKSAASDFPGLKKPRTRSYKKDDEPPPQFYRGYEPLLKREGAYEHTKE